MDIVLAPFEGRGTEVFSHWLFGAAFTVQVSIAEAAIAPRSPPPGSHGTKRFLITQDGGGLDHSLKETVFFYRTGGRAGEWFLERRRTEEHFIPGQFRTSFRVHDWVSSRECPALRYVMAELPAARAQHSHYWEELIVTHEPVLSFATLSGDGMQTQFEYRGPLKNWWSSAENSWLKACWIPYPA